MGLYAKLYSVASAFIVIACLSHLHANEKKLIDRFFDEYPLISKELDTPFNNSVSVKTKFWVEANPIPMDRVAYFLGEVYRVEVDMRKFDVTVCYGTTWAFSAIKKKGDAEYSLERVDNLSKIVDKRRLDSELTHVQDLYRPHYCIYGTPLIELIRNSKFKVLHSDSVRVDGSELLRIDYEVQMEGYMVEHTVFLDPTRKWVIKRLESKTVPEGREFVTKVDYGPENVYPREVVRTLDGKPYRRIQFLEWSDAPLDPEAFTLEYYGFPEYRETGPLRYFLWAVIGLAVSGSGLLVVRRLRK